MKMPFPPLKVWLLIGLAFVTIQGVLFLAVSTPLSEKNIAQFQLSISTMEADFKNNEDALRVVVVGNSLIARGVQCPEQIMNHAKKQGKEIQLNKIFLRGSKLKGLNDDAHIFERLIDLKPHLVCIQSELLVVELENENQKIETNLLFGPLAFIKEVIAANGILLKRTLMSSLRKRAFDLDPCKDLKQLDSGNYQLGSRKAKSFESTSFLHPNLKALQNKGIKTIILDIPALSTQEKMLKNGTYEQDFERTIGDYKSNFNIGYWKYEGQPLNVNDYFSAVYLNEKGSEAYSRWLVTRIIQEFN